jgi:hypothetical protein
MRIFIIAALAAGFATSAMPEADLDPFVSGAVLDGYVSRHCSEGCIVFNRAQAADLEQAINAMVAKREEEARREGTLSCRNSI